MDTGTLLVIHLGAAVIAAIPPVLAILWSHKRIHAVVNSRLDAALALVQQLETKLRNIQKGSRR